MAKKTKNQTVEIKDGGYLLKIVLYLLLGSLWLKIGNDQSWQLPIPIGLMIGLLLTTRERFKIDRKIGYAILIVAAFIGFWTPFGLYIRV